MCRLALSPRTQPVVTGGSEEARVQRKEQEGESEGSLEAQIHLHFNKEAKLLVWLGSMAVYSWEIV